MLQSLSWTVPSFEYVVPAVKTIIINVFNSLLAYSFSIVG